MSVSSISQTLSAVGAYDSQAQYGDAKRSIFANLQSAQSASQSNISDSGKVKSSLADLQSKARAIKNLAIPPTYNDLQVVFQGFVQSFNQLNKFVNEATSQKSNISSSDLGPRQTLSEIQKAISGQEGRSSLAKVGVSFQQDGSLSINQNTFFNAFQSDRSGVTTTLTGVADRVASAIDKQLSSSGINGQKNQDLSTKQSESSSKDNPDQARIAVQQNRQRELAAQIANTVSFTAKNAVTTYFSVAGL